jgi:hypothetical protein
MYPMPGAAPPLPGLPAEGGGGSRLTVGGQDNIREL